MAFLRFLSAKGSVAGVYSGKNSLQEAKTIFSEILELNNLAYLSDDDKTKINKKFIALLNEDFVNFGREAKKRLVMILLDEKNWLHQPLAITKASFDDLAMVKKNLRTALDQINDSNLYLNFALQGFCKKTFVGKVLNAPTSVFGDPSMLKPNSTIGNLATILEAYLGVQNIKVELYSSTIQALKESPEVLETLKKHFPKTHTLVAGCIGSVQNVEEEGNRYIQAL